MKLEANTKKPGRAVLLWLATTSPLPSTARKRPTNSWSSLRILVARIILFPACKRCAKYITRGYEPLALPGSDCAGSTVQTTLPAEHPHQRGHAGADMVNAGHRQQDQHRYRHRGRDRHDPGRYHLARH